MMFITSSAERLDPSSPPLRCCHRRLRRPPLRPHLSPPRPDTLSLRLRSIPRPVRPLPLHLRLRPLLPFPPLLALRSPRPLPPTAFSSPLPPWLLLLPPPHSAPPLHARTLPRPLPLQNPTPHPPPPLRPRLPLLPQPLHPLLRPPRLPSPRIPPRPGLTERRQRRPRVPGPVPLLRRGVAHAVAADSAVVRCMTCMQGCSGGWMSSLGRWRRAISGRWDGSIWRIGMALAFGVVARQLWWDCRPAAVLVEMENRNLLLRFGFAGLE